MNRFGKGIVALLSMSMILTGCGGIATQGSGANTNTDTNQKASVIKIGAPYPLTGAWAENGLNCLNGMKLAADEINQNGGIKSLNGAKIEIVSADTGSDNPSNASTVTARLINDQKVSALVGAYTSSFSLPASTAAEQAKVPMLTQSYVDTLTSRGYKYIFQLPPKASVLGSVAVKYYLEIARSQGKTVKTVAIVGSNDASMKTQMDSVKAQAEKAGLHVGAFISFPVDLKDASAIVSQIAASHPDVIFTGGPLPALTLIIKTLRDRGVTAPVVGPAGGGFLTIGFPNSLGKYAEGAMSVSAWNDDMKIDGLDAAVKDYEKKHNIPFMPQEAGESYVAVYILAAAIEQAKSADPQKIRDALASVEFTTGLAAGMPPGKVKFDSTGLNTYAQPIVIQWQDGVPRTIWPKEVATATIR